jgi:hypothetical protein
VVLYPICRFRPFRACLNLLLGVGLLSLSYGQSTSAIFIDASAPVAAPQPVKAVLGTSTRTDGETLTVNSQYLMLNGKPWLPVMGEFHYSRYPEQEWEPEILKMKAAGVQVVSTYVIWIHHEEIEGQFDWSGQRDLRHFVELCAKHGLYVYPRIGPWAHAEARNGGLPDWVVKRSSVRRNNPIYLAEVQSFYSQIGEQLKGLLWKDGGPVIGIQLENEYHESGPGAGNAHIEKLKQIAIAAGMDVPLYTVTGWDGAAVPLDAALPVFGGYPAAPWSRSAGPLPPSEIYAFRFDNRVAGDLGAIGGRGQNSAEAYRGTPFLTAEVGDGIEDTYFRRPVLKPDDIAAIAPVMLGSGANMLGFYMFHGGRNPEGRLSTLQESQRTGYPTDVPVKEYDFQAPISEFGEERESFRRLKLIDYFLDDFGSLLAPMHVYAPTERPSNPSDISVPRVAARADGKHAFLFFNNYIRDVAMPSRENFQVHLQLEGKTLDVPRDAIQEPAGSYGIWPINLEMDGYNLIYSTAQLFKLFRDDRGSYYFFFEIPGIAPEFALDVSHAPLIVTRGISTSVHGGITYLKAANTSDMEEITLGGTEHPVHLVLMPRAQAEDLWDVDGANHLLLTGAQFYSDNGRLHLYSDGNPNFAFSIFDDSDARIESHVPLQQEKDGLFTKYAAHLAPATFRAVPVQIKAAANRSLPQNGPLIKGSKQAVPLAPDDSDFKQAAIWEIKVPEHWPGNISNVFLKIDYRGDVARLYSGNRLLDDNFWNGNVWQIGLKEIGYESAKDTLRLYILPLPTHSPVYLESNGHGGTLELSTGNALRKVEFVPQYQLSLKLEK